MSILESIFAATTVSKSDLRNPRPWLLNAFAGAMTKSGESISPSSATTISSYYAALRAISEDVAKLPLPVFRMLDSRMSAKELVPDHPVFPLLMGESNENMTSITFRETLTSHALGWGNGFAEIERDASGNVRALHPIHPSRVTIHRVPGSRRIVYRAVNDADEAVTLGRLDILHLHGLGDDGIQGFSVAKIGAESLGLTKAAESLGGKFFGNSGNPSVILRKMGEMTEEAKEQFRLDWLKAVGGDNQLGVVILEDDVEVEKLTIPPNDAQFLQTRQFQIEEIARWFRCPPHKIMHLARATFNNIEMLSLLYVIDTLMPWFRRWEQEIRRKLFIGEPRIFCRHDFKDLLRGDKASHAKFLREMFMVGAHSQNDIRDELDLNPISNGDTYYVPMNLIRAEDAAKGSQQRRRPPPGDQGETTRDPNALQPVILDCFDRIAKKEVKAVSNARNRYNGRQDAYESWVEKFFGDHKNYLASVLAPVVMVLKLDPEEYDRFLDRQVVESRQRAIEFPEEFNNGGSEVIKLWAKRFAEIARTS